MTLSQINSFDILEIVYCVGWYQPLWDKHVPSGGGQNLCELWDPKEDLDEKEVQQFK